jgi:hypothetical protein
MGSMDRPADDDNSEEAFPLHALDYHWEEFEPHLVCHDSADDGICEFDLDEVSFTVSRKKTCVGYFDSDDKYIKCPSLAAVTRFQQCEACSGESFIPHQECVFEPRCDGEICNIEFCKREHVLYIAFYDTRMKIGMSSTRRVERRLIEQGADAFSIIGAYPTRKRAREAEKTISSRLRIPQSHKQETLLRNLSKPLDHNGIEGRQEALRITLGEAFHLKPEPLRWLDRYPIELPLKQTPELLDPWGKHRGNLVGIKGKWMIYESRGLKAVSLSELPSRYLARTVA